MNLNLGGFLGAALGGGGGFAISYAIAGGDPAAMQGHVRYALIALILGALAGNFLWAAIRGKPATTADNRKGEWRRGDRN